MRPPDDLRLHLAQPAEPRGGGVDVDPAGCLEGRRLLFSQRLRLRPAALVEPGQRRRQHGADRIDGHQRVHRSGDTNGRHGLGSDPR